MPGVSPAYSALRPGTFVRVRGTNLGRGKLVDVRDGVATVAYFDSPAEDEPHEIDFPASRVEAAPLKSQQRVFITDLTTGEIRVGRVDFAGRVEGHLVGSPEDLYCVSFPNKEGGRVPLSQLQVRWKCPLADPVGLLAARTVDTPYWHEGRASLMASLMRQRARCGGLTGLLSASVELELHQFRIVHTVLNDPVQRYLLADEVGLGKTIEAGAILRQYVLEHPDEHEAIVVVPSHLRTQWIGELRDRFHLARQLDRSIRVLTVEDLDSAQRPGLLIVDEAHHPASLASSQSERDRACFATLAAVAMGAKRVLLLSATPVLHNEDGFLAMLHLLDPNAYPLEDREGFRRRVQQRQAIAEAMGDLLDDAPAMFVEDALDSLEDLLADDEELLGLIATARQWAEEDEDHAKRRASLSAVRAHVGELYRLHRRLLRNRRSGIQDLLHGRSGPKVLPCPNPEALEIEAALEEWRADAMVAVERGEADRSACIDLWALLLRAQLSHPEALKALVLLRLRGLKPDPRLCPLTKPERRRVAHPPLFDSDHPRLEAIAALLEGHEDPRPQALLSAWSAQGKPTWVVFADQPGVADALAEKLSATLGFQVRRHRGHEDVEDFLAGQDVQLLICDRTAEEGLNLQRSAHCMMLHYDLPLSPNRIEQRIGRLDRFGARRKAQSLVFEANSPLHQHWLACLSEELQVFSRSIASLQYVLDEELQQLVGTSFERGVEALSDLRRKFADKASGLQVELDRIRQQENLDALEADPHLEERFVDLEDMDQDHDTLAKDLDSWLLKRMHFRKVEEDAQGYRVRYLYQTYGRHTLIPLDEWIECMGHTLQRADGMPATPTVTWSRRQASRQLIPPLRLGNPVLTATWVHAERDDRGAAYCMWRWRPECQLKEPLVAFRFDLLVDAAPQPITEWLQDWPGLSEHALRRRLDALLAPRFVTIWVSEAVEVIEDPDILEFLTQPYNNRGHGYRDYNLHPERWAVAAEHIEVGDWSRLVRAAEQRARKHLAENLGLVEHSGEALARLGQEQARSEAQRRARLARLERAAQAAERDALERDLSLYEAMARALRSPRVRSESAGAVILAGWSPWFNGAG